MKQAFDPLNLILLSAVIVVFWRLWSVLGRRTGKERPPLNPYNADHAVEAKNPLQNERKKIALNQHDFGKPAPETVVALPIWAGFAEKDSPLAIALEKLAAADQNFHPKSFLEGAKSAYEMILATFATGDKATLKNLLKRDLYDSFASAISARLAKGEMMEQRFVGFNSAKIVSAQLDHKCAAISVDFVSEVLSMVKDSTGAVISGDQKQIQIINDVWTFERMINSRDPNWKLSATDGTV